MARKRMFDSEIISQDSFLELPMDAKALYFLLGMEADDEGFISPKKVLRLYGGTEDSLRILATKNFIIPFKTGVIVITDWQRNNYLDKNRIKETIYQEEKKQLILNNNTERYELLESNNTKCLPNVKQMLNQNRIEENIYSPSDDGRESSLAEDFEKIWHSYPRKEGKGEAYKHYKSWLKGRKYAGRTVKLTNKQMWYAVKKYAEESKEKEKTFIKMGSTFFASAIMDYVEARNE